METEIEKKPAVLRTVTIILCSLLCGFMLFYAVMALLSPSKEVELINNEFGFKVSENVKLDERLFTDSAFLSMTRQKSYYEARVLMAETDSISLALNLSDSTATLEINGVAVHKAKVSEIRVSKVFNKADEYAVSKMLAIPFTIGNDYATIMKEPLMLKMAPKDTSEYKPNILPDTTNSESVNYRFEMVNGIRLYIYQNVGNSEGGALNLFIFDLNDRLRDIRDNLKSMFSLKVPEYHPAIRIRMQKSDAKIIYRALPKYGQVAVFR
jgi:hypothetical protein